MPPFSTLIWDWNGTLLDDVALCSRLLNHQLARHGYAPVGDVSAYRRVFRFPIRAYYQDAGFDFSRHPFPVLAEEYMELYQPQSLACPLQPGARQVLAALQRRGVRQVILSASRCDYLAAQVAHFGLTKYFDVLLGLRDIYARSKVEAGLRWISECGLCPADTVMIGDSVHDYETACALGVRCVLFSGGHQPRETLAATGAPVIDRLEKLLGVDEAEDK